MCRSIKTLRRRDEPASDEEIHAAALQFVRKVTGYRAPSRANEAAFQTAVDEVSLASLRRFTTVFGMGTGGSTSPGSPRGRVRY